MSRKRKKARKVQAPVEAVVEDEILAEGSGPIVSDEVLAEAAAAAEATEAHAEPVLPADDSVPDDADNSIEALEAAAHAALDDAAEPTDAELDAIESEVEGVDADSAGGVEGGVEGLEARADEGAEGAEGADAGDGADGEVAEGEVAEGASLPLAAAALEAAELKKLVEALVFASDKPVTVQRLRQLTRVADTKRLEATLVELQGDYAERGLILTSVSGGWQFRTQPRFSTWVQQLIAGRPVRLSRAQLETLAIIAYRQPITRPEIDDIRGVDSSATLKLLLDRQLIRVLGKREEVGRPMLYGTTKEFLDFFSLGDLRELPTLREYSELSDESRRVMTDRLGISAEEADATAQAMAPSAATASSIDAHSDAVLDDASLSDMVDDAVLNEAVLDSVDELASAHETEAAEATDAAVDAVAMAVDAVAEAVDAVADAAEAAEVDADDASGAVDAAAEDMLAASDADVDADAEHGTHGTHGTHGAHDADDAAVETAVHAADAAVESALDAVDAAEDVAEDIEPDADNDEAGSDDIEAAGADDIEAAADDIEAAADDIEAAGADDIEAGSDDIEAAGADDIEAAGADELDAELDAPDANTLSSLAERILAEDAARESEPRIDVDAMPGVRADTRDDGMALATDDIVDDETDTDSFNSNESE